MTPVPDRPPTLAPDMVALYEARAIHDLATLQSGDYVWDGLGRWVIAQIHPDPGSGAATVPGAWIDGDTGTLVNPGQADAVLVKKGRWQTLIAASSTAGSGGRYEWHEPLDRHLRTLQPADLYSPFVHGGTVVFSLTGPNEHGRPFGAVRLLYPGWVRYTEDTLRRGPLLERQLGSGQERAGYFVEVQPLLTGPDPLAAVLAFRHLLRSPDNTLPSAAALLRTDDPRKLAVLVYLALRMPAPEHHAYWDEQIVRLLRDSASPERLLAIGYAAFAVSQFETGYPPAFAAAQTLTLALLGRVRLLQIDTEQDVAWQRIFSAATLPTG